MFALDKGADAVEALSVISLVGVPDDHALTWTRDWTDGKEGMMVHESMSQKMAWLQL